MRRQKNTTYKPDEIITAGPFGFARYGSNVVMKNLMSDEQHNEFVKKMSEEFPDICKKIDQQTETIKLIVQKCDPLKLLQCSYFKLFHAALGKTSEADFTGEDIIAQRMIDYIQSVIAAVPPSTPKAEFTEEIWNSLCKEVTELYTLINGSYHIARTAHEQTTNPDYEHSIDEFYVKAQLLWTNVRGNRYQIHEIPHFRDLLSPHDSVFTELFDITIEDFLVGIEKIIASLTMGLGDTLKEMELLRQQSLEKAQEIILQGIEETTDISTLLNDVIKANGWHNWRESIGGRFFGYDLFDVGKITGFPEKLLKELSWEPGQDQDFYAPGNYAGWPLRILPINIRPFLCIDGHYYCFDKMSLMDNLYRILQRLIIRLKPNYQSEWNEKQKKVSEDLPFDLLSEILPNSKFYKSVYYRWKTGNTEKIQWCENDGIILFDDHLITIEVKGGAFTYTPPATDFEAYINSVKNLLLAPATQGSRFLDFIESEEEVTIYDENHEPITKLRHDMFRVKIVCCVTLDNFTTFAARAENLGALGVNLTGKYIWAISIDDLRVYIDVFDLPTIFTHFIEVRQRAFNSAAVDVDDELDHLGLYFKYNHYEITAEEFVKDKVIWHGFREKIDEYYHQMLLSPSKAVRPSQLIPPRVIEIINLINDQLKPGCCMVTTSILDCDNETRENINHSINDVLKQQRLKGRILPLSLFGDVKITIFCHQPGIKELEQEKIREYSLATMLRAKDETRLSLELYFSENDVLENVNYYYYTPTDVGLNETDKLNKLSEEYAKSRIRSFLSQTGQNKVGRNQLCPCGSGKKYKHCCSG